MPQLIEGHLSATGLRFAIVASRFNGLIVEPLIAGALDAIVRSGGDAEAVTIVRCPGAWELPQVVRKVIARGGIEAVIALGAVIRGATPHFDYVAGEASHGIAGAAAVATAASDVAVSFGVLTTDTIEQALERAGTKAGNKGFDAALAAIELATLFRKLAPGGESAAASVVDPGSEPGTTGRGGRPRRRAP
ncbi:MAG TPA: 6,7-dimethyl-8-ribityllumazine synthase [Kofleriaceae bacterium]|jgi:6,7-dimethyl-8-ribityllumazine synthase|nr:6,7-dimethyl-8-ribityllumazine synthase [Kofleriaceae bacterium]